MRSHVRIDLWNSHSYLQPLVNMADSLVTQVSREQHEQPPARKPRLKIDPEDQETLQQDEQDIQTEHTTGSSSKSWGELFSRQYTPSVPKTFALVQDEKEQTPRSKGRTWAQSPRQKKSPQLEAVRERKTHQKTHSFWYFLRSCFQPIDLDLASSQTSLAPEIQPKVIDRGQLDSCQVVSNTETNATEWLLPSLAPGFSKPCLVLDLDETLVHSSFKPLDTCDIRLSIEMDGIIHNVYVLKRPGVDEFLEEMHKYYELVIFTASLDKYANPLLDLLDPKGLCTSRLYREHCKRKGGIYIKDLGLLGRPLESTLIIDNSPHSYAMHPRWALPILSWFDDPHDTELLDMMPYLRNLTKLDNVSRVLDASKSWRLQEKHLNRILAGDEES